MASDVRQNFSFETEFADGNAILSGLLRGRRRSQFNILDTKGVKSLGNGDLGRRVEEGISELLAFYISRGAKAMSAK